jgi:uncharacterized protein YbjT (DUF2867 family)
MTRAFVAGATGYTGREVVRALIDRGVETCAHVRPDSIRLADWSHRFAVLGARVDSTPWEPAAMSNTIARFGPDLVFGVLGTTRSRGRRAAARTGEIENYETVDYGLTSLLLRAAVASGARPRFVYLSSVGVRSGTSNRYLAVRWRMEQEIKASGLPYVIARPSFITGADRDDFRPGERVAAGVADAVLAVAGRLGAARLRDRYRSTTNAVLGHALVRLALAPGRPNEVVESEGLREARPGA